MMATHQDETWIARTNADSKLYRTTIRSLALTSHFADKLRRLAPYAVMHLTALARPAARRTSVINYSL
jgi:hypothetical protein